MDDDTKRALDALMTRMNDGFEQVLNRLDALERDFANTNAK